LGVHERDEGGGKVDGAAVIPQVSTAATNPAKPFLKWAGGKRQLLHELRDHIPSAFGRYFEPFVGGGAFFFDIQPTGVILGDINLNLIAAYKGVRDDVESVIGLLKIHERLHCKAHYFESRALMLVEGRPVGKIANAAARMIYINKTCFNGLFRVNKAGGYNVPMGRYENPTICDAWGLRAASRALQGVSLLNQSWEKTAEAVGKGDFVYFDSPYVPASASANFVGYARGGFGPDDQRKLRDCALILKKGGAYVLLSNSDTPEVRELYGRGFEMRRVEANRAINSKGGKRGAVGELLIW
jgi:DNA adenine methylase